ncbi:AraC family transcriptional regulator [Chitinophaga sp. Cy-1792]|uniref:AraC family transcriptional regulator n=1 Tax=Chitinophaga sp. Cy-1792 TaxID=2608339 RepID=UPI00141EF0DE|nr:AraC family transcriptional regulator [Chitinophaga sp. Cy-1792]NIG55407.1 AraC family transcriptional regulator [Chitinophaga sp. Cy-1792]
MKLVQFEPLFIRHFSTLTWPFPLHNHNHYELMFIRYGSGIHELNSVKTRYEGETIFFLLPEDSHDYFIETETEFNVIKFLPGILKGGINTSSSDYWDHLLHDLVRKWKAGGAAACEPSHLNRAKKMIKLMVAEWLDNNHQATEVHTHLLRALLLTLDRGMDTAQSAHTGYGITKIERIQHYIHANIYFPEKLTMEQLSHAFSISVSSLKALFKNNMGMSLGAYVSSLKLEAIKERMRNSDATLTEIAQEFGFTDSSHFTRFFTKQAGVSPLKFRKGE